MIKKLWVHDYEVYKNLVLFGFKDPKSDEVKIFELSNRKSNYISLKRFLLNEVKGLIGFNNLAYDSYITDYFLTTGITNPLKYYELSQRIIRSSRINRNPLIPQLDVFKICHWDNKARMLSLKAAELRMNHDNVQDLPYAFNKILTNNQIDNVIKYLYNDLEATEKVYKMFKDKYYLRKVLKREYGLKCDNWSDSKIGEELLLKLYCNNTQQDPEDVRDQRTNRSIINVNDIIFDYIEYKTPQLKKLLQEIKSQTISNTKQGFKHVFEYGGIETHLAQGGIHASNPGIYKSNETHFIMDIDIAGMYPSIIIQNKLFPKHLGPVFYEILDKEIVSPRTSIHKPKSKDKTLHWKERKLHSAFSDGLKLSGNSVYGKSNDKFSFCYDPQMTMQVTINGQLMLLMLIESLYETLDLKIIQENTDGVTFYMKREDESKFKQIVSDWEKVTNLVMEYQYFDEMYLRDVNNFICKQGEYTKLKGAYEIDKKVGNEPALHKDSSKKIVAIAVKEYFINNIPVINTLMNHDNIYDFTLGKKATRGWHFNYQTKPTTNPITLRNIKTIRYYVSTRGGVITKVHDDGRINMLEAYPKGKENKNKYWKLRLFNKFKDLKTYEIDYSYYERECNKLIKAIEKYT